VIDVSLETPIQIREFQRKLYTKAKQEPCYRFYLLYDKVYREDILAHAYSLAKANGGAPGVDGESFAGIESEGLEGWLAKLKQELQEERYRPQAVRRVMIPKANGGQRPLGIPTVRDRVVQTAAKLIVEPILEADLEPNAYGYRPKRSAQDAVQKVHEYLRQGYTDVVDADLSRYFDTIPHAELMQCVARRIIDRRMLHLIKMWLTAPVMEQDGKGNWRNLGSNQRGTPQGGVISPLLANLYMNRFLKYWQRQGKGEEYRAGIVAYADDFVILTRRSPTKGMAQAARNWTQQVMSRIGLTLNEQKTSIRDAWKEDFDFLGYTFGPRYSLWNGKPYIAARPSKKSIQRLTRKVSELLQHREKSPWAEVRKRLNAMLRGWSNYFGYGTLSRAYQIGNNYVERRVRQFLRQRHRHPTKATRRFSSQDIFGTLGVERLARHRDLCGLSCEICRKAGCWKSARPV
jgi:RNA-directed DNA polymerase